MNNHTKNPLIIVLSILLVCSLFLSGCSDREMLQKDETRLPSVTYDEIVSLKEHSLHWLYNNIDISTGTLEENDTNNSLTNQLLTGHVLATYSVLNTSFLDILDRNLHTLVKAFNENLSTFDLLNSSLLLSLLYLTPEEKENELLEHQLTDHILSFRETTNYFISEQILSRSVPFALSALSDYVYQRNNESIQKELSTLVSYYQKQIKNTPINTTDGYFIPWFTHSFKKVLRQNVSFNEIYESIIRTNNQLITSQETRDLVQLGRYMHPDIMETDNLRYQLHALESMMNGYTLSKTTNDTMNQTRFHQSLILNLMYLKNTVLNNSTVLSSQQHLTMLLVINKIFTVLPDEGWSYLFEASTQTLFLERTLETTDAVWVALTIGVVLSIVLLFIVFFLVKVYYKYKKKD
ncbi:MAG: hypothetical protein QCI00_06345 [Candidatus Thermoplasmatota archaeon]|nr:hypothetical protein [Candidatus Thermoplasmatota archaeon]